MYLEKKADSPTLGEPPQSNMVIIDGSAVVNALKPDAAMTFKDYAANKFISRISRLLSYFKRIDVVFDLYSEDSLTGTARLHRGQGSRKRVRDNYKVPSNWKSFLCHSENKTELFSFLANCGYENFKSANKQQWFSLLDPQFCASQCKTHQAQSLVTMKRQISECFFI